MEIKIHSTPGRGKKQCPECKVYLGVRNGKCICGHEFVAAQKKSTSTAQAAPKKQEPPADFNRKDFFSTKISTPAGKCPANLADTDYGTVEEWAGKILRHGEAKNVVYAVSALRYWARQFYEIFSEEHKLVTQHLNDIMTPTLEVGYDDDDETTEGENDAD
jgi:uncharacterized Zn finger protein (UPF0148 family)